jgi:hypothetical protein
MCGYLLHAWRIALRLDELGNEVQNLLLTLGKLHGFHLSYTQIVGDEMVKIKSKKIPS